MNEKRKSPRIGSLNLSYICFDREGKVFQQAMGRTLNISEGGFSLETHFPLDHEYTVSASIGLKDDIIEVKGAVAHCRNLGPGKYLAGIQITDIKSGDRERWSRFIHTISGPASFGEPENEDT
jgi:hypothetical protein